MTELEILKRRLDNAERRIEDKAEEHNNAIEVLLTARSVEADTRNALDASIIRLREIQAQYKALKNA